MYFLESSSFVKLFIREVGTERMIELVESAEDRLKAASALATVEVRSAIRKRQRIGHISSAAADAAIAASNDERRRMTEYPISALVLSQAAALIDKYGLRTLDAIQLATALVAQQTSLSEQKVTFVCSDQHLAEAAISEGFLMLDPAMG